jgi:hypothetical protein
MEGMAKGLEEVLDNGSFELTPPCCVCRDSWILGWSEDAERSVQRMFLSSTSMRQVKICNPRPCSKPIVVEFGAKQYFRIQSTLSKASALLPKLPVVNVQDELSRPIGFGNVEPCDHDFQSIADKTAEIRPSIES